jgi:isopentenyl phosphate kinase
VLLACACSHLGVHFSSVWIIALPVPLSSTLAGDFIRNWLFDLAILPFRGFDLVIATHSGMASYQTLKSLFEAWTSGFVPVVHGWFCHPFAPRSLSALSYLFKVLSAEDIPSA